jgi:hypothetical protein
MSTGARIAKTSLSPDNGISFIMEEYEHHQLTMNRTMKKVTNSAFSVDVQRCKSSTQAKGPSPDTTCYNCNQKGRKEGQGPKRESRRGAKVQNQTASITAVPQVQKDFAFASVDATPEKSRCAIIDSGATSHHQEKITIQLCPV